MRENYDFINEPTKKALFRMFLPMMIGMLLNFAYNIVDTLWVGNLMGDTALAALTGATPIVTLTYSFGMGITNGMGILLSKQLAKNDKKEEERIISSTLVMTAVLAVILVAALECSLVGVLVLMNTKKETFQYAKDYLMVYLIGMVPSYIFCHVTAMLRCYGDSIFQMISLLVTSILNAVLDPVLIRAIGFHGAAVATVLSQTVSLINFIGHILQKETVFQAESSFCPQTVFTACCKAFYTDRNPAVYAFPEQYSLNFLHQ